MNTKELRKVAEAATPGVWVVDDDDKCTQIYTQESDKRDVWVNGDFLRGVYVVSGCGCCGSPEISDADAAHIAAFNPQTAIALLDRLSHHEANSKEWAEKTDWVQATKQPGELGEHRADVLRNRLAAMEAENAELQRALQMQGKLLKKMAEELEDAPKETK